MRMEYNIHKQNLVTQQHEIKDLKTKCKFLQEAVKYYRSNTMSSEGENSANNNNMTKVAQEHSVNEP